MSAPKRETVASSRALREWGGSTGAAEAISLRPEDGSRGGAFLLRQVLQRDVLHVRVDPRRHLLLFPQAGLQRLPGVDPRALAQCQQGFVCGNLVVLESIVRERILQNLVACSCVCRRR